MNGLMYKIFVMLLTVKGFILPSWQNNYHNKKIYVCDRVVNSKICVAKKYSIEDYLRLIVSSIDYYSKAYNVNPLLLTSIIRVESSFRPDVNGKRGEVGLCQIIPYGVASKDDTGKKHGKAVLMNPMYNIKICAIHLKTCQEKCNTDNIDIIANCHNTGSCRVLNKKYINRVKKWYNKILDFVVGWGNDKNKNNKKDSRVSLYGSADS